MTETDVVLGSSLKIACSREELAQKLAVVSRGVSTRTAVQILGGILVRAGEGKVELAATDMELSLRTPLDAKVEGEGAAVVPGRLLADLAKLLPQGEVEIEYREEENILQVRCGPAEYRLNTYSAEDFPRLPDTERRGDAHGRRGFAARHVSSVGRAVSRDEARPVLTGILVKFGDGKLVMAATDSYRLSYKETPFTGDVPDLEAIIPARALDEVKRLATPAARSSSASRRTRSVRHRRHLADHAPHRGPVPEGRRAEAEGFPARGHASARRAARGRATHVGDGAPQLAAAPTLRRRRGDGLDADAGHRGGA